jgi:hypothetical protein
MNQNRDPRFRELELAIAREQFQERPQRKKYSARPRRTPRPPRERKPQPRDAHWQRRRRAYLIETKRYDLLQAEGLGVMSKEEILRAIDATPLDDLETWKRLGEELRLQMNEEERLKFVRGLRKFTQP